MERIIGLGAPEGSADLAGGLAGKTGLAVAVVMPAVKTLLDEFERVVFSVPAGVFGEFELFAVDDQVGGVGLVVITGRLTEDPAEGKKIP